MKCSPKFFLRSYVGEEVLERECLSLEDAEAKLIKGEKIHICRHSDGKACSLLSPNHSEEVSTQFQLKAKHL